MRVCYVYVIKYEDYIIRSAQPNPIRNLNIVSFFTASSYFVGIMIIMYIHTSKLVTHNFYTL